MLWPLFFVVGLTAALWLHWRLENRRLLKMAEQFPGPPALPLLGNALQFMGQPEDLVKTIRDMIVNYGDIVRFWLGPDLNILISDPDELKSLLTNPKTSYKGRQYKYISQILGGGILSGSGPIWKRHRKIAMPNYGIRAVESYETVINDEANRLVENLTPYATGEQFDIYNEVVKATSFTVCQTLMGLTRGETVNLPRIMDVITKSPKLYHVIFQRMTKWYLQIEPIFRLTSYYKEQQNIVEIVKEFSKAIVDMRRAQLKTLGEDQMDLLNNKEDSLANTRLSIVDRFLLTQELDDDDMWKETFTIFTSSQEASAKISSFLLMMMAFHPQCQAKLYEEITRVIGEDNRPVTGEDLKQMTYLDMVFKEIARLFPTGAMLQRTIHEDIPTRLGTLPAGCSIIAPIYHLSRDPRFWNNPDDFDPERFTPENIKLRHPNCYIPFSLGPMDCFGRYYGAKLIKTICAKVLQKYEISALGRYQDFKIFMAISATSLYGYKAVLKPRKKNNL